MVGLGSVLGNRYELWSLVDAGGTGVVWQATDQFLEGRDLTVGGPGRGQGQRGDRIVVKTYDVTGADELFGRRFIAEIRGVARIAHPGVVSLINVGYDDPIAWVAMRRELGESLRSRLARTGAVPVPLAMAWLGQVATAVAEVHRLGVVHRGLRPSRLFVRSDERVVLTDFGPIRGMDRRPLQSPEYLSPEDAMGEEPRTFSDTYQLGLVAYACLTGRPPFQGEHPLEVAMMHLRREPPPLPDHVPTAVRQIVLRCLAKSPTDRWPDAEVLARVAERAQP
jgi:serine/threonine protein kinase